MHTGKPLTGQIMEGNAFHFAFVENAGSIFPPHPHITRNLKQRPSRPVEWSLLDVLGQ